MDLQNFLSLLNRQERITKRSDRRFFIFEERKPGIHSLCMSLNVPDANIERCIEIYIQSHINWFRNFKVGLTPIRQLEAAIKREKLGVEPPALQAVMRVDERMANQRRRDSLARLLAPSNYFTPCIAVTMHNSELYVATNTYRSKDSSPLAQALNHKIRTVRAFLTELATMVPDQTSEQKANVENILIPNLSRSAEAAARTLLQQGEKPSDVDMARLEKDLRKLGKHFLLGLCTDGRLGFTNEERTALVDSMPRVIIPAAAGFDSNHAEQVLADRFKLHPVKPYLGISKLCCKTCDKVVRDLGFEARGTHGKSFPNVHDVTTGQVAVYEKTDFGTASHPPDSDSDVDIQIEHPFPGVAELVPDHAAADVATTRKHRLELGSSPDLKVPRRVLPRSGMAAGVALQCSIQYRQSLQAGRAEDQAAASAQLFNG